MVKATTMASYSNPFLNTGASLFSDHPFAVKILGIFILSLFLFTNLIKVNPGHFLAIIVTITVAVAYIQSNVDTNSKIMESLFSIETEGIKPRFMYLDADLVELFESIKRDFYQYNPKVYESALKACDNLLRIKNDMTIDLLPQPEVINNNINFETPTIVNSSSPRKVSLVNTYENYEAAKIQYKLCINYIYSLVVSVPSNPVLSEKYKIITKKAHVLLKRNLDEIYHIYQDNRKVDEKDVSDYDLEVPINSYSNGNSISGKAFEYI